MVEVDSKIDPLLDYRLHLLHEIRETEELIAKKEAEMKHIEEVDSNQSMLQKNVLQAFRLEFANFKKDMKRVR